MRLEHVPQPEVKPDNSPLVAGKFSFTPEELAKIEREQGIEARKKAEEKAKEITDMQRIARGTMKKEGERYDVPPLDMSLKEKIQAALERKKLEEMYKKEAPEK